MHNRLINSKIHKPLSTDTGKSSTIMGKVSTSTGKSSTDAG